MTIQGQKIRPDTGRVSPGNHLMLNFTQYLDESFNKPYPYTGGKKQSNYYVYNFKTDDGSRVVVKMEEMAWSDDESSWSIVFLRNGTAVVTGEGDALKIFATVIATIKDFVKKVKPQEMTFSAEKPNAGSKGGSKKAPLGSREKLYARMTKRFAQQMGYNFSSQSIGTATDFRLVKR